MLPARHRIGLRHADARSLPFPDATFDAALSCYVLDHFSDDDQHVACHELARVLRPGGRLVTVHVAPSTGLTDRYWQLAISAGLPLLGGSRPVRLKPALTAAGATVLASRRVTQFGLPSMIHRATC